MVYADNAATTRLSKAAWQAMLPYFDDIYGNPSSIHRMGQQAKAALEDCRTRTARILHCEPREILFTSGGSESDNQAIFSAAQLGASSGSACTSGSLEASHVLLALGRSRQLAYGSLRLSLSEENTVEEVDELIRAVTDCIARLREESPLWQDRVQGRVPFELEK